jgi:glycosyltransferase involved in cell wall biosynthesis
MASDSTETPRRIAFVSTRIQGTDGVSLEIGKWADVLERMGHQCFYIAGACDRPAEVSAVIPEAHFAHPAIEEINRQCFGREVRSPAVGTQIHAMARVLKEGLREALRQFDIDLIIAENCVTIPMNIPLGLAVVETIMESGVSCIAHHHDFVWERERFSVNAVDDHLHAAFPPPLSQMQHVAISSRAAKEFSRRTGLPCRMIPNVMDFQHPPAPADEYSRGFRASIGLAEDDYLILQPTRIVQRKGIETSLELIRRLDDPRCKLVITHGSGDEGHAYAERVRQYADMLGVQYILAEPWIANQRGTSPQGRKLYTIWDAYAQADFVTYPSTYEGFGNAFLEAVYARKPILCNLYGIYRTDIEPCGFEEILMDGFLTDEVVDQVRRMLTDEQLRSAVVEHNFEIARHYFSYDRVETELRALLAKPRLAPNQEQ